MKSLNIWGCDVGKLPPPLREKSVSLRGKSLKFRGEPTTSMYLIIFVYLPNVRDRITE